MIRIKRAYDDVEAGDGMRILVDRLWPRGKKKEDLSISEWYKDLAPGKELRRFAHSSGKWDEFKRLYFVELDRDVEALKPLLKAASETDVTLIYSSWDREHNNAVALKDYLEKYHKI